MKKVLWLVALWAAVICADAQSARPRSHAFMLGAGSGNVLDTYLSPYAYTGSNVRVMRETQRCLSRFFIGHTAVRFQTLLDVDASLLDNPAGNVNEYAGGIRYSAAWQYPLAAVQTPSAAFDFHAGPMLSGYLGGVYNERNGNNPAQAKADLMLDFTASADCRFRLWQLPFTARYQLMLPIVGAAFSPNYGQSYYEMFSLGNYDHNVVMAHTFNAPSLRHLLTLDFPLSRTQTTSMLRIGYAGAMMQAKFNGLRYHSYAHSFLIGFTKQFSVQ